MNRIELSKNSWIDVLDAESSPFQISPEEFFTLWDLHPEEHGNVIIYGKKIPVPRWQKSYINAYSFSGLVHKADDLPKEFEKFFCWGQSLKKYDGEKFNQVLINWYENGLHYIGSHSDDETQLVKNSEILSISLGETRKFRIREKKDKKIVKEILLEHGTVVIMGGKTQKEFKHEIVKVSGKKGEKLGPRINITLRQFK